MRLLILLLLSLPAWGQGGFFFGANFTAGGGSGLNARHVTGSQWLTGPTLTLGSTGSVTFKEQHAWAQADNVIHIFPEAYDGTNFFQLLKGDIANNNNLFQLNWGNGSGTASVHCSSTTVSTNTPHTWLVTWSSLAGSTFKMYLDGVDCTAGATGTYNGTAISAAVGFGNRTFATGQGTLPCECDLWDLGFWSTTLTSGNAATLSACGMHPSAIATPSQEWDLANSSLASQSGGSALVNTGTTAVTGCTAGLQWHLLTSTTWGSLTSSQWAAMTF